MHTSPPYSREELRHRIRPRWGWWMPVLALVIMGILLGTLHTGGPLVRLHGTAEAWAAMTVAIVFQALPFLVLGVVVSGAIAAFVPASFVQRVTPRNELLAVPSAVGAGMFLPGCECASVPVSQSLMRRGLTPAAALAFLLASPAINPVVLVSTAVAFNGQPAMVAARFLASVIAATLVGWAWMSWASSVPLRADGTHSHDCASRWEVFGAAALHDLMNAGGYLALGAMAAALIKVTVPAQWFAAMGDYPVVAIALMTVLAVVLSLCSEADAFVAASLSGVSPTAQLVFLVVGPMVDLKLMAMQYGTWGRAFVLRFVPLTLGVAVMSAIVVGGIFFQDL